MKTAIRRFDRQLAADGRSTNTRAAYNRDIWQLTQWLGNQSVSKVRPDNLARFLTSDEVLKRPDNQPRKPITVNRTKSALRSFFAFCANSGWIKENPARLIRSSPAAPKEPAILENSEIRRLRQVLAGIGGPLAGRDRLIFELLLGTGIRLGSLVNLNIGDLDPRTGTLLIYLKGGTEGHVFLNPGLRRLMAPLPQRKRHTGRVCSRHAAFSRPIGPAFGCQANPAAVRPVVPGGQNWPIGLTSLPPAHVRHPALRKDRGPAPSPAGTWPPADYDYRDLCEGGGRGVEEGDKDDLTVGLITRKTKVKSYRKHLAEMKCVS